MAENQASKSEPAEMVVILEERLAKRTAELRATKEALEQEIQARARSQQALAESEQRYRTVVEHGAEGILVMQGGRREYYNPTWLEMTGYSAEEYDSLPFLSLVYTEDREMVETEYHDLLRGQGFGRVLDLRIVTKSGDIRWLSVRGARIEWENEPAGVIFVDDITERVEAKQALAQSEERYRALVEQAQDGIILLQDGRIRFANPHITGLTGYAVEELLDTAFEGYVAPDQLPQVADIYRRRLGGEPAPSVYEAAILHRDGSRIEVEFNAGLTTYAGKPADLVFIRDVRERVRARQELEESQRLLNLVIDHVPALVSYMDRCWRYRFVNLRYEQARGIPRSQFVGKHVQDILGPEGFAAAEKQIAAALAGEEVSYEDVFEYPGLGRRWMSIEYVPDRDATGEVQGLVGTIRDITEWVEAEQALAKSEAHLRRAQEVAQAGSWELDLIRGELFWSDEVYRIFGLPRETFVDYETFLNCVMPEERDYVNERWQAALAGAPYDIEHRICVGDGVKWVREKAEVAFDRAGRPIRGTGIVIDITAQKATEEQILEYQQRLQALASQLTLSEERERRRIARELHDEVGQRLTFARMALASARETTSETRREALLDDVSLSVRQAIGEIRDLVFDLSSPLMNEVGLTAALEEWLENQVGKKHGLRVKLVNDGRLLPLDDDVRAMLFRSTRELLTNVVKHARAESVIVCLEGEGTMVRITVKDDGIGLDPDALPRATDRGSGFGLFSIQERMAALGGSLELLSAPGQGCKAILIAPVTLQWGAGKTLEE